MIDIIVKPFILAALGKYIFSLPNFIGLRLPFIHPRPYNHNIPFSHDPKNFDENNQIHAQ